MFYLAIILFIIGYLAIALEHPLKVNKTASALLLAVVMWVIYAVAGEGIFPARYEHHQLVEHLGDISEIIFFLLGAMTIVELIDSHEGFRIITDKIHTTNKVKLLWILSFITFFLSALLDNLTTAIVMCALLRKLIANKHERWFFAGMVVLAANAGGAWSPIGDVTTIMLWIAGKVTTLNIIVKTFLPSLVSMIVPLCCISLFMKGNVSRPQTVTGEETQLSGFYRNLIFGLGVGSLLFVPVFKTLTGLPPYLGILFGVGILWVATEIIHKNHPVHHKKLTINQMLTKIDMPSVLFFLGILLAVAGLQVMGHLDVLAVGLNSLVGESHYTINLIIGVLSSVVDNVPLVAGAMGMYNFPTDDVFWEFLAYCAGTGGSLLIIGSAAGVAVMGMEKIDFIWYLKKISIWALLGYASGAFTFFILNEYIYHLW